MEKASRVVVFAGLVIIVGLVIYLPGLSGPLFFDDKPALTGNELVKINDELFDEWRTAAFSSNSGALRRPLTMLTFAANYALAGSFSPFGLKVVNLAIHLTIAALMYCLFCGILGALAIGRDNVTRSLIAVAAAAIWLLHPLHVSTVLYAVQRMTQLSTLFVVLGLLVFTRYRQSWAVYGASVGQLLAAVLWLLLLTALAVLSKENGILLPWLIFVLEVTVFGGVWAGQPNRPLQRLGWILLILPVVLGLLLLVLSPDGWLGGYARREFSLEERTLTQVRLLWHYIGWICLPNINDMGFQHDDIPLSRGWFEPVTTLLASVAWLAALIFSFLFRHLYPLALLGILFFLVGQSIESTVLPLEMVYEHRNYLPSMFVCLVIAALLIIPITGNKRINVRYPIMGFLAFLCVSLFIRVQNWSDELTLFQVDVRNHPESSRSNYFYANALLRRYRQREQLGLSEQQSGELLLLSRFHFERMYQANNRDVAAVVMLYYLDSKYFPELQERLNWLAELEVLLKTKTLQPSDWNALETLIECFSLGPCIASQARVIGLLDRLSVRYPQSEQILRYRYRYLSVAQKAPDELLPLLQQAQEIAPGEPWIYYALLSEYARKDDAASSYHYAQLWQLQDRRRLNLLRLKSLFIQPEEAIDASGD